MITKNTIDPAAVFAGFSLDEAEIVLADFITTLSRFQRLRAKHLRGEHHDPDALNRFHAHMVSLMGQAEQAGVDVIARRKMAQWVGYTRDFLA